MPNRLIRASAAAAALAVLGLADAPPIGTPAAAQGPSIRIDFRAVAADGQPVTDLKPGDVSLRIAGKPREITDLELVQPGGGGGASAGPATPAFTSNAGGGASGAAGGRNLLLVIDDESINIGREQGVKAALASIVDGLNAGDRVGLFSVRRAGGVNLAPTTNHAQVLKAIESIKGEGTAENTQDFRCRTTVTLQQLEALIANATGPTPTTIAFFSASLMQPGEQIAAIGGDNRTTDLCRLTSQNFEALATAAAGSRAHVYVAHVPEGTTMGVSEAALGVESVAGSVGAETLRLAGDGKVVADRILAETGAYYVATIAADASDKTAQPQRMELRVERPGVTVRARQSISPMRLAAGGGGRGGGREGRGAPAGGKKMSARDMIRVPDVFTALPLRASAYASSNQGDKNMRVVALFEPEADGVKLESAVIGLFTPDEGRLVAQWTAQAADLARTPPMGVLAVAPGRYRMRVAAVDAQGRSGTVDHPLNAELTQVGQFQASSPLFGPAPSGGGFAPKLLFTAADTALVSYVEIYGVPKDANVTATLELAPSEDAQPMGSTETQVRPGPAEDVRIILGGFSIDSLAPGEYVVRTVVSVDGKPVGRIGGTMRKTDK